MIFKSFDPTDIVEGRTTRVASGFWPNGNTSWSASYLENNFWDLSNAQTPSTAYGSSPYDVRKTLYYTDVYPDLTTKNTYKDPYFSIAYGHIAGGVVGLNGGGSGSFDFETGSIRVGPAKAIYNQYKNLLLGNTDIDGKFSFKTGSTQIDADDIYVINFSTYKTKDRIDEGTFQISLASPDPTNPPSQVLTFIDDSPWVGNVQQVYQLVLGTLDNITPKKPDYIGVGLLYPNDGIVVFNASKLNELLRLERGFYPWINTYPGNPLLAITASDGSMFLEAPSSSYFTGSKSDNMPYQVGNYVSLNSNQGAKWNSYLNADLGNQNNTQAFWWSLRHSGKPIIIRKSEYVPSRQYFVRVKNRDFNYSNNPTYVYDGKEQTAAGIVPPAGTIRIQDFYTDPRTYITTVGLYNDTNELVAVAKLSRPAVKSFDNELLIKIRLDF